MASSGSKSVTVTSWDTLKFSWETTSQSVANNTSTISWKLELIADSSGRIDSSTSKVWKVTVNGTTYSGTNTVGISNNSTKTLASSTTTIAHNADGTKTFSYSFSQEFGITFSGSSIGTKTGSGTGTLDTIARASSVSSTSANIGSAVTISISRASSSFTHTLTYSFGSLSGTIATKTTSTSVSWTLPTTFYAQIPSATSKTGTITCTTYSGSTSVGSKTCTFTAKVSSASAPGLTVSIVDTDATAIALTGDSSKLIKYYSDAKFTLTATAKNSATISSYSISGGGKSSTSSTGTLSNVTGNTFTCKTKDSRGFTTTVTKTMTMVNYVKLTCVMDDTKPSADGIMTVRAKGNYFNGSFGAASNTLSVQFRYKTSGGSYSNWITMTNAISNNTYESTYQLTGLDYKTTYVFQMKAVDKLATITTSENSVKTLPIFDWGENDFNFNVETNWNFGVDITATKADGTKRVAFTPCSTAGNTTIGYGSYDEEEGHMNIYGNDVQIITNEGLIIDGREYGANQVLWSGAYLMNASQTATLSAKISEQPNGIVLVFSRYSASTAQNYHWQSDFIPKEFVSLHGGNGHLSMLSTDGTFSVFGSKYLYIHNDKIVGNDVNTTSGTGACGITYNNGGFVLRYVIGV